MKTQAKRNSDIKASRKNLLTIAVIALGAIIGSMSLDGHAAETRPVFEQQHAFVLNADDQAIYRTQYGWCMPVPNDQATQCYVLGSDMVGYLGAGDTEAHKNLQTYGDVSKGLVAMDSLPGNIRNDALTSFRAVWGN